MILKNENKLSTDKFITITLPKTRFIRISFDIKFLEGAGGTYQKWPYWPVWIQKILLKYPIIQLKAVETYYWRPTDSEYI